MNQRAKYLGQRSFRLKIPTGQRDRQTDRTRVIDVSNTLNVNELESSLTGQWLSLTV